MTEEQMQQSQEHHGKSEQVLLRRLAELGWIVDAEKESCYDAGCADCTMDDCKRKELL